VLHKARTPFTTVAADTAGQDTPVKNNAHQSGPGECQIQSKNRYRGWKNGFIGVGGDIDGKVNPNLKAAKGDVIEILLVNGDGAPHDLVVPDLQVGTEMISGQGAAGYLEVPGE
jgi:hypothetical protein